MPILDCSTRASTLRSLSAGFGCSPSSLSVALLAFDLDALYETDLHIDIPPEEYLYHYACERFGAPADYSSAYWFHGTRTVPGNLFSDGLLSLEQSEKRVMDMLIALAPDTEVSSRLQKWNVHGGVPEEMFRMRTLDPAHWGPYGYLIRETHEHASLLSQHEYLGLPELVEDVCRAYQQYYGRDLSTHYQQLLQPCIVWFISVVQHQLHALSAALSYAYTSVRGIRPSGLSIYGIDRGGIPVSHEQIVNVEFL
ncbi:hypothetical protein ORM05_08115 [Klebsiella michiganensis]|uniref:hypothetical protein n=1 Tax=Klebsiella TaxID=570 RepID=UPI00143326E0|nr:hypothetical protein [Klebsiella michiganensis]NKD26502.1 hypothetical protein [Citrobacter freundii]HBS6039707.1 hypothetical protein [Klebsiella aerogenes]HEM6802502.1 hypothetical protein [Citrobacter koseri]ELT9726437.1 hypothetical protein [Klebsiella michiganensis]MCW9640375.1 hypothetical protein [Klebsiella michiganensis]